MSDISTWLPLADFNDHGPVPDFLPEGGTPIASVNDWVREAQASIRRFYEAPEWRDLGYTAAYKSDTEVTVQPGTLTSFNVGQRVRLGPVVQYATITAIAGDVDLVLDLDAGVVDIGVATISVGTSPVGGSVSGGSVAGTLSGVAVTGSTIDNTVIGGNSPDVATFTAVQALASFTGATGVSIDNFSNDPLLAGNSPTTVPVEQAIKIYVDTELAKNPTVTGGAQGNIVFRITPTTGIMLQWGRDQGDAGVVSFAPNFSATPYSVIGIRQDSNQTSNAMTLSGYGATGCTFAVAGTSGTGVHWIAIGPVNI